MEFERIRAKIPLLTFISLSFPGGPTKPRRTVDWFDLFATTTADRSYSAQSLKSMLIQTQENRDRAGAGLVLRRVHRPGPIVARALPRHEQLALGHRRTGAAVDGLVMRPAECRAYAGGTAVLPAAIAVKGASFVRCPARGFSFSCEKNQGWRFDWRRPLPTLGGTWSQVRQAPSTGRSLRAA